MNNKNKLLILTLCVVNLSSCMMREDDFNSSYARYYTYERNSSYPSTQYPVSNTMYQEKPRQEVHVPSSYHVGAYHSPVSFKDRDSNWVNSQNPQGYTIEIADDEKAARVAQKLSKTPKNDRMAEIPYQRDGKSYYKGVYGSYDNAEAAKKALDSLPADVKQGAGIKNWGSIQNIE